MVPTAQMRRIGSNQTQGVGSRLEQQPIDKLLVVEGDLAKGSRQGKDQVEIGHRQQLGSGLRRGGRSRNRQADGSAVRDRAQ